MSSIRLASRADGAALAEIYRPIVERTAISFETDAPDPEAMGQRIADIGPLYPWLVCEAGSRALGYAYASPHRQRAAYRWSVDVSVYVASNVHRCGVASGLYTSLLRILAAQGFFNAFAGIALPNPASVALHESHGFTQIGVYRRVGYKLGRWHDVGWWHHTLNTHQEPPAEPLPLPTLQQRSDWAALLSSGESRLTSALQRIRFD